MRSGVILPFLFFFTLGVGNAGDASIHALSEQVAELEQLIHSQQARIRKLTDSETPSIFYPNSEDLSRAYTDAEQVKGALTHIWLIICGALVVFMQMGFAMLQSGFCRMKNAQTVLLNNLMTICVGTLAWWVFGFTFAFGKTFGHKGHEQNGGFIGGFDSAFGMRFLFAQEDGQQEPAYDASTSRSPMVLWFFQWALCSVTLAIANAGVAERSNPWVYAIYTFLLAAFIYPVVVAWTWGEGWLYDSDATYMDRGGSGIIHITGGFAALIGAAVIGPRSTRWNEQQSSGTRIKEYEPLFDPHSVPLLVLGTFIIWFGMYGLNCGSTLTMNSAEKGLLAGQIAMNTTISAAMGGLIVYLIRLATTKKHDVPFLCKGILGGLVAIAAPCSNVESGTACAVGIVSGFIFLGASSLLKVIKIDDPVDAFAVHGACGIWGVLAAGLFDWGKGFDYVSAWSGFKCIGDGNTCDSGIGGALFVRNLLGVVVIMAWVVFFSLIILFPLKLIGILRCKEEDQETGIDEVLHFPQVAYNYQIKEEGVKVMVPEESI